MQIVVFFLLIIFPVVSQGEVYRWVDENGQVHFGSVPPKMQKPYARGEIKDNDQNRNVEPGQNRPQQRSKDILEITTKQEKGNSGGIQDKVIKKDEQERKSVTTYKIKTEEEKNLVEEKESKRNEKFQKLIKRLKNDLGDINKSQQGGKKTRKVMPANNLDAKIKEGVVQKKEVEKAAVEIETADKKKVEDIEVTKEIESVEQAEVHYNEKCGFFRSFVENYQDRIKYECPSEHCDLLKKKLEKYKNKARQYCTGDNVNSDN